MHRLLFFAFNCLMVVCTNAELVGNETCSVGGGCPEYVAAAGGEEFEGVSFPMNLIWPPSRSTIPNLVLVALAVWAVVGLAMISKESDAEKAYQNKRSQQILAQLAQTQYEHLENSKKWNKYNERKSTMMQMASERFSKLAEVHPKTCETEESIYQQLIVETGFASEDPPDAALEPKRVFEVLIDEVEDRPVIEISSVGQCLGSEKYGDLCGYFSDVRKILLIRLVDKLDSVFSKTEKGFKNGKDPRYTSFSSGVKLAEIVELAKKVQKQFFPKRLLGLKEPETKDPQARRFLKQLKDAKVLLKDIRRSQPSRLVQILGFFELQTFAYLGCAIITRVCGGAIGPARGFLFNKVVLNASLDDWQEPVIYNLACLGVIFFFDWYVNDWLAMVATTKATSLLKHSLRTKLFEAVMRQDAEYFEANDASAIQDRVKHDCDTVADHAIYIPMDVVGVISSIVGHLLLMYAFCPRMLPRTLATGCVIAPLFICLNRLTNTLRRKDDRTIRAIRSQTDEMLNKVKAVREFSREKQEAIELDRGERVQIRSMIFLHIIGHLQHMLIFTLLFGGEISNYYYGASLVNQKQLNPVKLIQIGGLVYHITFMMRHLMEQVPRLMRVMIPAVRIFELLESKSLIEPMPGDRKASFQKKNGGIELELRDVTFAYPLMPEITVLRHLSLTIPIGKTVAICGERAAGKTTIYSLMQRMYDVEFGMGEVIVNDHPISHWDVRSYRRAIAILSQKGLLFKGTIKENILYGLNEEEKRARNFHTPEGDAELQRLLDISGAWDIVKEFPLKMEQRIGTGGVSLSGGTEQCLFIARGLVKEPAMLMMDEATSAMDTNTQKRAAEGIAVEQKRLGFSVVQVAHRIETLSRSDVLYFVENGKVVEVGGLESLNGAAVEELSSVKVEFTDVTNPETGLKEKRLTNGFYRQLHEAYYDLNFHNMDASQLVKKVKSLEEQLVRAKLEKQSKLDLLSQRLPAPPALPLERAATQPKTSQARSKADVVEKLPVLALARWCTSA
jgi:ABC-type multidrug transport system fused ATPase/permease subunit